MIDEAIDLMLLCAYLTFRASLYNAGLVELLDCHAHKKHVQTYTVKFQADIGTNVKVYIQPVYST